MRSSTIDKEIKSEREELKRAKRERKNGKKEDKSDRLSATERLVL